MFFDATIWLFPNRFPNFKSYFLMTLRVPHISDARGGPTVLSACIAV
jgi:hypothetical protein